MARKKRDGEAPRTEHGFDVCVDFDGVVHSYDSGWKGPLEIPDPPVAGAFEALRAYLTDGMRVHIYSSRSKEPGAVDSMRAWFVRHGAEDLAGVLSFPTQKPAANMTIDDRAFCFGGHFPAPEWIRDFQPWNKRPGGPELTYEPLPNLEAEEPALVEWAAGVTYEVIRGYALSLGDDARPPWDEAPADDRARYVFGVRMLLEGVVASPGELHRLWVDSMLADGWAYGPELNREEKVHPGLVPWDRVPPQEQAKGFIFRATVGALRG